MNDHHVGCTYGYKPPHFLTCDASAASPRRVISEGNVCTPHCASLLRRGIPARSKTRRTAPSLLQVPGSQPELYQDLN